MQAVSIQWSRLQREKAHSVGWSLQQHALCNTWVFRITLKGERKEAWHNGPNPASSLHAALPPRESPQARVDWKRLAGKYSLVYTWKLFWNKARCVNLKVLQVGNFYAATGLPLSSWILTTFKNELYSLTRRKALHGEWVFKEEYETSYLLWKSQPGTNPSIYKPLESCFSRRHWSWWHV